MSTPHYTNVQGLRTSKFAEHAAYLAKIKAAKAKLEAAEKETNAKIAALLDVSGVKSAAIEIGVESYTIGMSKGRTTKRIDETVLLEKGVPAATIAAATKVSEGAPFVMMRKKSSGGEAEAEALAEAA